MNKCFKHDILKDNWVLVCPACSGEAQANEFSLEIKIKNLQEALDIAKEALSVVSDCDTARTERVHSKVLLDSVLRAEKLKPKFEPFWIGKKTCCDCDTKTGMESSHTGTCICMLGEFLVEFKYEKIYIGNFVFHPHELKNTLTLLCRKNFSEINRANELYVSSPKGIHRLLDNYIDLKISWEDCDKILDALEKAGF